MYKKYKNRVGKYFDDVLRIKTTPKEIALGFSIGTFFANFPTLGLEFIILFYLVFVFQSLRYFITQFSIVYYRL